MQNSPYKKAPKSKNESTIRVHNKGYIIGLILACVALLALMYILFPHGKQMRAVKTLGGLVENKSMQPDSKYSPLIITEVMSVNASAVPDENGEYKDYIEIYNSGDEDINLKGVGLSDRSDRIKFLFPDYNLKSKSFVVVFASNKNKVDAKQGIFHAKFKLSSLGESVYLFDPNAYVVDFLNLPMMGADEAYMLGGDGKYFLSHQYSPGYDNTEEGYLAYKTEDSKRGEHLRINEIMPNPKSGLRDEDDELQDWIELFNDSDEPISLANFALSDKEHRPLKWRFPAEAEIEPRGYYIIYCSGKDRPRKSFPHTNFKLSAEHETIVLSDSKGRLIDRVTIDNVPSDTSYGLNDDGEWQLFNIATPGSPNNKQGELSSDKLLRKYNPTGVIISEALASNDKYQIGQSLLTVDYVELLNTSNKPVNLSGYGLSDNIDRPRKWQFPAKTIIRPGEYMIVLLDGKPELSNSNEMHANFKLSKQGSETMCFSDSQGRVLDRIPIPSIPTDIGYGRLNAGYGFTYFRAATPATPNSEPFLGFADPPSFSIPSGEYKGQITVEINIPLDTAVRYTLDGSIPNENSTLYEGPINISKPTVLRARAFHPSLDPSTITTQSYMMNLYHSLPIVSLAMDPHELFNMEDGIFQPGPNVDKSGGIPFKNTIYRQYGKRRRPCHVEIFEKDGTKILDQDCEAGLQGQFSLDMPQKTLKFRSKSKYGKKYFESELFPNRDFDQYKSFVLRNSGNDNVWTRLADLFQATMADQLDTTVLIQAGRPVVLYINGDYWGHYNLRERVDRWFVASHEGIPLSEANNMDIVEANRKAFYGSNAEFTELKKTAEKLNTRDNPEDLKYLTDRIDVINYFDYLAIEMFYGNSDPGNTRCYKLKEEGSKWRWILFDIDYGLFNSDFNSPKSYLKPSGSGQQNIPNILIRKLLENDSMKDLFLQRFGIVFKKFTTEYMLDELQKLIDEIEPEMVFHFNRWAEFNDKAINFDSPTNPEGAMSYWKVRINRLRNVIKKRPHILWGYIQEEFKLSDQQMLEYFGPRPVMPEDAS